jgi:putative DNA primase/helicase
MADDNIVRLAELLENGNEVPPTAEDSIALLFADRHSHELRYVAILGRWRHFDGSRWAHDDTLRAFDRARMICREVAADCEKAGGRIASAKTVAAVERLARSDRRLAATAAQWDAEPWLLVARDRTIDLRTGIDRAPDPTDYITKTAACGAAPTGTPHPIWTTFLRRITADDFELETFLQRYVGYCCSGHTSEHAFVFAHGTGANGKSTFVSTISKIFGEYATVADMNTFLASNSERHPTDLAKLAGARLVVAQETQRGRRWDETKIKALTGGDKITARFMRQDYFDYEPTFKLLIAGNHKPRLGSVDEAMRRRLLLVPFTVQIPPAERDPELARKLEPEWPAILRWCIDGCLEWQRIGLSPPAVVCEATESYLADQDNMGQWLEERTHDGGQFAFTLTSTLFASWKAWCEDRNLKPGSASALSEALADRGFAKKREPGTGRRGFAGLTIGNDRL